MTLLEYCDVLNLQLDIRYYPNQDRRFCASFSDVDIKNCGGLLRAHGNGPSAELAVEDYLNQIRGRRLVQHAMSSRRREFDVPKTLSSEW